MLKICLQVVSKLGSESTRSFALAYDQMFYFWIILPGLYGLLLELHALTLATRSYALLYLNIVI